MFYKLTCNSAALRQAAEQCKNRPGARPICTGDRAKVRKFESKRISELRPRLHISFIRRHRNTGDTSANCRISSHYDSLTFARSPIVVTRLTMDPMALLYVHLCFLKLCRVLSERFPTTRYDTDRLCLFLSNTEQTGCCKTTPWPFSSQTDGTV